MNKLRVIIIGVAMLALSVGGTAFALFSSQVSLTGLQLSTGTALLQVGTTEEDLQAGNFTPNFDWNNLYPGYSIQSAFVLKNASTAPIELSVRGLLVAEGEDLAALDQVVTIRVMKQGSSSSTGFKTLSEWRAEGGISLPGGALAQGEVRGYTLDLEVASKYPDGTEVGNEISGKSLQNLSLQLNGTQD